ncbi:MAG: hydratase [bacterium]|nr:hydratase [bacterium]
MPEYPGKRLKGSESLVKVAALQMEPHIGDKERNVPESVSLITKACEMGVKLMVLPELCNTGYMFNSREEAFALSETVPEGPSTSAWIECCKKFDAHIVAGIAEREDNRLYDSAVVLGPEGHIGTYRKLHLWNEEKLWFEPGNLGLPVFDLTFGRIGCRICYDVWFPETSRILAAQGTDIICDSTNWVVAEPLQSKKKITAVYSAQQNSLFNSCFSICSDRTGLERGQAFIGSSIISNPSGDLVAGPGSPDEPEIVLAEINLMEARYRHWSELNNPLTDRRLDVYDTCLGYDPKTGKSSQQRG